MWRTRVRRCLCPRVYSQLWNISGPASRGVDRTLPARARDERADPHCAGYLIAANPWIDTTRLGVTGGSYGGYLTNWIISHTNRFKAAVTIRSISNFISDDGTRDGAYGHADDFGGDIFEKHDLYWERSPLKYVKDVTTPILILHSDNDYRVPIEQAEQWFRALKHFGKTAEIVFFPRENHNLTRTGEPRHLVESMNWQLYWFDRYLLGNTNAVAPDHRK